MIEPKHPSITDHRLQAFAEQLCPGSCPVAVKVRQVGSAVALDCFENVKRYIETKGGSSQLGWRVIEVPNVFFEAEFHAVWVGSSSMLDVTPPELEAQRVAFIPDRVRQYDGRQVCNEFFPLRDSPAIQSYIGIFNQIYEQMNAGSLATYHGPVVISPELQELRRQLEDARRLIEGGQ